VQPIQFIIILTFCYYRNRTSLLSSCLVIPNFLTKTLMIITITRIIDNILSFVWLSTSICLLFDGIIMHEVRKVIFSTLMILYPVIFICFWIKCMRSKDFLLFSVIPLYSLKLFGLSIPVFHDSLLTFQVYLVSSF
jgi:hypothetical protein